MNGSQINLSERQSRIEAERCRRSFYLFVRRSWPVIFPNEPYVDGRHIELICNALEHCLNGDVRNLIINIPFRHMKSLLVNVFFPAWVWSKKPEKKFLFTSYALNLITRDSLKCKDLVTSDWYKERFGVELKKSPQTTSLFYTTTGGHRQAITFGGGVTGEGGDFVCVDDPLKATDAYSEAIRKKVNEDYQDAISNRVSPDGCRIIIMQRLHFDDLCGHILKNKDLHYEQIVLPVEFEGERYNSNFPELNDWRTVVGEPLWPQRFDRGWVAEQKANLTAKGYAGQLQQRPAPLEGTIYKRDWFANRFVPEEHLVVARYQSWDTASSIEEGAAYSTGITFDLLKDYRVFIRDVHRKRIEFPQLEHEVQTFGAKWMEKLKDLVVEYKSSGIQVVQSLKQTGSDEIKKRIKPFNPRGKKEVRGHEASKWAEKGMVILPPPSEEFPWLFDFEEEIFNAPNWEFLDQFDSFNQGILYLKHYLEIGLRGNYGSQE